MTGSIFLLAAAAAAAPVLPEGPELKQAVLEQDMRLFELAFEQCAPEQMKQMLTPDFEFYHDRGGAVRSADAFVDQYAKQCREREMPGAWRSRRELVTETYTVHPVPGFGAIEDGEHLFYERQGTGAEILAGKARFTQLWALTDEGWRLARVFSYAHGAAE